MNGEMNSGVPSMSVHYLTDSRMIVARRVHSPVVWEINLLGGAKVNIARLH